MRRKDALEMVLEIPPLAQVALEAVDKRSDPALHKCSLRGPGSVLREEGGVLTAHVSAPENTSNRPPSPVSA